MYLDISNNVSKEYIAPFARNLKMEAADSSKILVYIHQRHISRIIIYVFDISDHKLQQKCNTTNQTML